MERYIQIVMHSGGFAKPIVIGTSGQVTLYELLQFYRPELLDEKYEIVEISELEIDKCLNRHGEDSIDFI